MHSHFLNSLLSSNLVTILKEREECNVISHINFINLKYLTVC